MNWTKPKPNRTKGKKMDYVQWGWPVITKNLVALILTLGIGSNSLQGQQNNTNDSLSVQNNETTIREAFSGKEEKVHSPHKATFYSAILPGLGQAYNKKYWKIPVIYTVIGGLAYGLHFNSTNYIKYKNAYRDFLIRDPGNKSYEQVIPPTLTLEQVETTDAAWFEQALENRREYYKRYRDLSYIGMVAFYVLNMIDASVDAHFYNFDVSDDLSMDIHPVIFEPDPTLINPIGIRLSLKF